MNQAIIPAKLKHFTDRGHRLTGVVHVGANDGEELPWYQYHLQSPILAFEPLPAAFELLDAVWGFMPDVQLVNVALGDRNGFATLHVDGRGSGKGSSFRTPIPHPDHPWTAEDIYTSVVTVEILRFDDWAFSNGFMPGRFNTLVIDTEGHELEVLKGLGVYLGGFDFLNIECSEEPLFKGQAPAREVIAWLDERGFRQDSPTTSHDDIMFVRRGL